MTPLAQNVTFTSGNSRLSGYIARPTDSGPSPGVIVIHEAYGLNDNIRDISRRLAGEGYIALAVDLFSGRNRAFCMFKVMGGLLLNPLNNEGTRYLKAALTFLGEQEGVDVSRLGAIGFCMGGGLAIAWACTDDRLRVIAPFYGTNPRPLAAVARSCPVVGSYPGADFTARSGRKLDAALDVYRVPHEIKIYPGAKHSFFNDQGAYYDPAASADGWERTLTYFGTRLGTG
ncbi:MAG: dienelactone hydrolase family protein [Chloroflexia bacterium]